MRAMITGGRTSPAGFRLQSSAFQVQSGGRPGSTVPPPHGRRPGSVQLGAPPTSPHDTHVHAIDRSIDVYRWLVTASARSVNRWGKAVASTQRKDPTRHPRHGPCRAWYSTTLPVRGIAAQQNHCRRAGVVVMVQELTSWVVRTTRLFPSACRPDGPHRLVRLISPAACRGMASSVLAT